MFAGLLLPACALGDRLGRRRVLLAGLAIFGIGAAAATTVDEPSTLIAIRAVMGLGAALIMPTTLSIITANFPAGERDRAVGAWAGVAGGSALLGLLVSGSVLELASWPWVFGLSVLLAAIAFAGSLAVVPAKDVHEPKALDPVGGALSAIALSALVWAFIEGPERGWSDSLVVGGFVSAALLGVAFVAWELRRTDPMLDPGLFKLRGFSSGSLSVFVQFFAAFGLIFVLLQVLQLVLGNQPAAAGGRDELSVGPPFDCGRAGVGDEDERRLHAHPSSLNIRSQSRSNLGVRKCLRTCSLPERPSRLAWSGSRRSVRARSAHSSGDETR